jgi:hypothetical protein
MKPVLTSMPAMGHGRGQATTSTDRGTFSRVRPTTTRAGCPKKLPRAHAEGRGDTGVYKRCPALTSAHGERRRSQHRTFIVLLPTPLPVGQVSPALRVAHAMCLQLLFVLGARD